MKNNTTVRLILLTSLVLFLFGIIVVDSNKNGAGTLSGSAWGGSGGCGGSSSSKICKNDGECDPGFLCYNDDCLVPELVKVMKTYQSGEPFRPAKRRYLRDEQGRAVILHGINMDNSVKHQRHSKSLTPKYAEQQVKEWGFNGVRYLMNWAWIEPEQGEYDETYLDGVEERVQWYSDLGSYVFLDMHQDLYGQGIGGNGAPAWATETDGLSLGDTDYGSFWWLKNLEPAIIAAYKNFWNYPGKYPYLQEAYIAAWEQVVTRFKDNPAVLGYDLMNEPHAGDLPLAFGLDGFDEEDFEPGQLNPLYKRLIKAIRKLDNDTWIFFEPQAFGTNFGVYSSLSKVKDPRQGESRLVYAPHIYPAFLHEDIAYGVLDRTQVASWAIYRAEEATLHGSVLHVGEIGASDQVEGTVEYFKEAMALFDYMGSGWSLYAGDPSWWGPIRWVDGPETPKMDVLVRTYPQKIAGDPVSFSFLETTKAFKLVYKSKEGVTGPTEIFIPAKRHYPEGWVVTCSDADANWRYEWDPEWQVLRIWNTGPEAQHTLRIERK